MKRLGVEIETQLPDEASFDEFQTAFASPLSSSTREAMQVLFPGQEAACLDARFCLADLVAKHLSCVIFY